MEYENVMKTHCLVVSKGGVLGRKTAEGATLVTAETQHNGLPENLRSTTSSHE
jgi:hypothetical protein